MRIDETEARAGPKRTMALVVIASVEDRLSGAFARGFLFACGISSALWPGTHEDSEGCQSTGNGELLIISCEDADRAVALLEKAGIPVG
jgi:hypothetical protein